VLREKTVLTTPLFPKRVKRLCRVRTGTDQDESPFPLDQDGFLNPLAARASTGETLSPGMLVAPATAADTGALVLLGEPGLGKTTVFLDLTEGLPDYREASEGDPAVLRLDAARLTDATFQDLLGRHLRALSTVRRPNPARSSRGLASDDSPRHDHALTVVLDQIDESPMLRRLADEIADALKGQDTSGVRILVACRTADYPPALTDVLKSAFGECVLADLAPLTRDEAVRLANSVDVDGEALITSAVALSAGALASVPLTLDLLVRVFREEPLTGSPAELFAKGVHRLADEYDARRRPEAEAVASLDQRLAVAGRIAARLLLSGRRTVWRGPDLEAGPLDMGTGTLAGGTERTVSGPSHLTPKMISATLGSGLFTGRGDQRLAFRHASLAAYLAARYLHDHQVPHDQLRSLFLVAAGDAVTSIPALLRETAAWLVALDPQHGRWLAGADPESLAAHSTIVDSPAMRALIVEALPARAPELELGESRLQRARWRLDHPGLAGQLASALSHVPSGQPEDWRALARVRLAVRLADEAVVADLAEPLLTLAEHDRWDRYTRQLAARTALKAAPARAIPRLRALLGRFSDTAYAQGVDPDDELRGTLLNLLWPEHLTLAETLVQLRPRRRSSLFGTYARFLRTMPEDVAEDDLPELLAWARTEVEGTPIAGTRAMIRTCGWPSAG
jgi:hypothetical protein